MYALRTYFLFSERAVVFQTQKVTFCIKYRISRRLNYRYAESERFCDANKKRFSTILKTFTCDHFSNQSKGKRVRKCTINELSRFRESLPTETITDMDLITVECCKLLDVLWRYRTKRFTSPRDPRSVLWIIMKALFFCGWYFLVLLLIRQVIVCSLYKRFICDNWRLKSNSLASITEERLDDNSENVALLACCTSGPTLP